MLRSLLLFLLLCSMVAAYAQNAVTVHFDFDKHQLTPGAVQKLEELVASQPFEALAIYGHCDQLGSIGYNQRLSERRAEAVRNFLVNKGIPEQSITLIKGLGETEPVIDQLDEESRRLNRRVTIVFTKVAEVETAIPAIKHIDSIPETATPAARPGQKRNLIEEIKDTTTRTGDNIVLKHINFYGGRHVFLPSAYPALEELLQTMRAIPTLEIEIQGHICCQPGGGDGMDNDTGEPFLSYNRARAVYNYLVRRGIDSNRMRYRGFGRRFPIIEVERTEEEKTMNRRVEIKILQK